MRRILRISALVFGVGSLCGLSCAAAQTPSIGAAVPWTTYEAEQSTTSGTVVGADYIGQTAAREASGRRHVLLANQGDFLEFTAKHDAQGIVVRYSIPESPGDFTLSFSINGRRAGAFRLTAKLSHLYGPYPFTNEPAAGSPRNFWDEARLLVGSIHAGDIVRLEKTAADTAAEYLIDFVDLEPVPAPLTMPIGALSVIDFGATADDLADDRGAFLAAIRAAKEQKKAVWIPPGKFLIGGAIDVAELTIQGAGVWHTTLEGVDDYTPANRIALNGVGSNVHLSDFSIVGKLDYRNDSEPNDAIGGSFGTHSTLRNLWIEHTKAAMWVVNSDGLLIENCRFRNTLADGINLCVGMRNTIVRNCTARNTGDDCFAIWPATYVKPDFASGNNRFENCTAQLPFLAQGFSIYGGEGNSVVGCEAIDIPYGCGLFASTTFQTESGFQGVTTYRRARVIRAGDREGAIGTVANRIDITRLRFEDIEVIDSPNDAIRFMSVSGGAIRESTLARIRIQNAGTAGAGYGIVSADDAVGSIALSDITVQNAKSGSFRNVSSRFVVSMGDGTKALRESGLDVGPSDTPNR